MTSFCRAIIIALLSILVNGSGENSAEKLVMCNFSPKSLKRPEPVFDLNDFDPTLCTHFIYHGSNIDKETLDIEMQHENSGLTDGEINRMLNATMSLRERNPQLKVLLGACCMDDETWDHHTLTEELVRNFTEMVANTLQSNGFDGLYVTGSGMRDYKLIATGLRQEFDKRGLILAKFLFPSSAEGPHLTRDVAGLHDLIVGSYWNLSLRAAGMISSMQLLEAKVEKYLDSGIPPEKLVVPIPAFSMSYILCDRNDNGLSAELCGPGNEGTSEGPSLIILYNELMKKMSNASEGWIVTRDDATGMMYGHSNSNLWASYEDPVSVRAKAQYIIEKNLAGGMIQSVDNDDFVGYNEEGIRFPLTRALHDALRGN